MCQGILYNKTLFPNIFLHRSQEEAKIALEIYEPLFTMCRPTDTEKLRLFLCSVYVQSCSLPMPCRSLCEAAQESCAEVPFVFPRELSCLNFPDIQCMDDTGEIITGRYSPWLHAFVLQWRVCIKRREMQERFVSQILVFPSKECFFYHFFRDLFGQHCH